jgi:hypothetical protein
METVLPLLDELCDVLNHWLAPEYGEDLKLKPDHDEVDALNPSRYEKWEKVNANNTLTVNEKRDAIGYEEIPDGDVILVPSSNIPLEDAVNPPDMGVGPDGLPLDSNAPGAPGAGGGPDAEDEEGAEGKPAGKKPPFTPGKKPGPFKPVPFRKSRLVRMIKESLS